MRLLSFPLIPSDRSPITISLSCAGKSRFPGLYIWLRNGKKYKVVVPDGCLLLQAGKQLEWLTGGHITAGFHEVVIAPETIRVINEVRSRTLQAHRHARVLTLSQ